MLFKKLSCVYTILLLGVVYCFVSSFVLVETPSKNDPPKVEIVSPESSRSFSWNSLVQYSIKVADKEDGLSEYDEINGKEVLLEVRYFTNTAGAKKYVAQKNIVKEHAGLTLIRQSDCFTCHSSKDKLIGPSFYSIAKRYSGKPGATDQLVKKVLLGGSGNWGNVPMVAHPNYSSSQAKQMVGWILNNAGNEDLAYYIGLEGAFKTKEKPQKKVMVLTASYTDHGEKSTMQDKKFGQHSIILQPAQ